MVLWVAVGCTGHLLTETCKMSRLKNNWEVIQTTVSHINTTKCRIYWFYMDILFEQHWSMQIIKNIVFMEVFIFIWRTKPFYEVKCWFKPNTPLSYWTPFFCIIIVLYMLKNKYIETKYVHIYYEKYLPGFKLYALTGTVHNNYTID